MLDKLTLHAQLAMLDANRATLDAAIADKTKAIDQMVIDLHQTRGARQYNDLLVAQMNNMLAEVERAEKAAQTIS